MCSRPTPDDARFCPSCGAALVVDGGSDEERRVVTVLFADIVGFTSLAEHRDPEQIKRLVDAAFARLVTDVEAHGGVVDKLLGDAIVALFGAPVAHEDDADRAVRAALAMQSTLRAFREEHPADELRMRIGVNTGEVLVGTVAGTDYTAMGDVVNTASRLQQLAPPGSVLVGDATKSLCSPALRFRPFDEAQLRGRDQAVVVWRAVAHDAAVVTRRWRSDAPFVGRSTELGMVRNFASIALAGRSAVVAVTGEAGIGKSRLVHEVVTPIVESDPNAMLLEGACAPYGESNVWWPIAGGMLARLGLDRDRPATEVRQRVENRLDAFELASRNSASFARSVDVIMHVLGYPSALDSMPPSAVADAVFAGFEAGFRHRAQLGPIVIWIDDLQWAAPLLLELLEAVARRLSNLPVLIVTTFRSDVDVLAEWPPALEPALTLHLPLVPLGPAESAELVRAAAGRELPDRTMATISARAGGNPLFLAELARLAAASPDGPGSPELPGSLRALIASQLDQLTVTQRALLDNAAILGTEGRAMALREFAAEMGQVFDPADLDALEAAGFLLRDDGRWQFRSTIVRDVAYQTLTKQARAQRHSGVARHLGNLGDKFVDAQAHHLASAAELAMEIGATPGVPSDVVRQATQALQRAARRWYQQGAHRRGVNLLERAVALDPEPTDRVDALLLLAEGLVETHNLRRARDVLDDVGELADDLDDRVALAEGWRLRGTVAQMQGDLVEARRLLGRAVGEFRELGDAAHLGEALRARGFAEIFGGSLTDAEWFLGEAEASFAETGNARGAAWVHQHRAWVSFLAGDHGEAQRRLTQAIAGFEQVGDRGGVSWARGLLAYVHHFARRHDEADAIAAAVLEEARYWGDDWGAAMMLNLQAGIRLWSGDVTEARALADKSLAGFRRLDDRFGIIQALSTLNRVFVAAGRAGDAERSVEEIMVLSDAFGSMAYPAMAAAGTAMHLGHGARAAALASDAVGRLDTTGANVDEARVVLAFGRVLWGDPEGALAELLAVDVGVSPFALAARATASAMIGDADAALADVRAVEAMSGVSYWDRWMARIAGVAVATGSEAQERTAALRTELETLEDTVVRAYAALVLTRRDGADVEGPMTAIRDWAGVASVLVPVTPRASVAGS